LFNLQSLPELIRVNPGHPELVHFRIVGAGLCRSDVLLYA